MDRLSNPEDHDRLAKRGFWDHFCAAHAIAERGMPVVAATPDGMVGTLGSPAAIVSACAAGKFWPEAERQLSARHDDKQTSCR